MKEYKVRLVKDETYKVVKVAYDENEDDETVFVGTLSDCEAWIRLTEKGYL